jgi:pimeloyl-ACP methyl ester carboxylesterase
VREQAGHEAALVGHSYGGYLALGVLGALERQMGVFLSAPILQPDVGLRTLPPRRFSVMEEGLSFADDELRQTFLAEVTVSSAEMLETFARVVDPAHRATDREFLALVRAEYCQSIAWSPAVRDFAGPLHVVCGRDDYWSGYVDTLPLVRLASSCRFTVLPGCGHLLPLEAAGAVRALFGRWLDELGGS